MPSGPRAPRLIRALAVAAVFGAVGSASPAAAGEHLIGGGLHYWQTVDDLAGGAGLDDNGVSLIVSYQYAPRRGLLRFELDLEYFDAGFGGSPEAAYSPVAYLVVGTKLYVAAGVGVTFSSGLADDPSDPFYTGRLGYQFHLLPGLFLDLNANYRTNAFEQLGDLDVDTFTLGVIARVKI